MPRLIAWADEHILRLPEPPRWLIELSLATDVRGLERAREYLPKGTRREKFDQRRIHLGTMYLAFERGLLPMDRLLLDAGQYADCCGSSNLPECEAFFVLLNEIEGTGLTLPSDRPLEERVCELFAPMAGEARAVLADVRDGLGAEESEQP
jgi:hypothetical protein